MGTDRLMEEIRALGGTMGRKNWKTPKSENGEVAGVLQEAGDFMDREGWRLPEREPAPVSEPREQTQISVLAEEATAFMDRSGWTLEEGNPRRTAANLEHAGDKLIGAAKLVLRGKRKYAAYEIQDALGDLSRVFTEFGIDGHPLRAAKTALMKAEDQLEGMGGSEKTVEVVFSTKDKATAFRQALDPNEVRGKVGIRKTKGWKTHSVVFKPHSFADRAAFLKRYKPEKPSYKDINKDLNLKESVEESKQPVESLKNADTALSLGQKYYQQGALMMAAKYSIYGSIILARKLKNRPLMVVLSKAYQMVEEAKEKEELGAR